MEHFRKQAKQLVRAARAGDEAALRRFRAVVGERDRLLLADAQHVVAREQGHRTWAQLVEAEAGRAEWEVDVGLRYTDDDPVLVHVKQRLHRYRLDDRGAAARLAGRARGWEEVAHAVVVDTHALNVDRRGVVFVPAVRRHMTDRLVARVGEASLALYLALLDLSE